MGRYQGQPRGMHNTSPPPAPTETDPTETAMESLRDARGISRVATTYQTAVIVHRPRKLEEVEARIYEEASRMGEKFVYSWRVATKDKRLDEGDGKTTIEGVSIKGAMILFRNFGNCALPTEIQSESPTHYVFRAALLDLETGSTYERLYRQRKNAVMGKMDVDRAEDISFQIGQSKAHRNVILGSLPSYIIEKAKEIAKDKAAEKYANTAEWYPKVVHFAERKGIPIANLCHRVGGKAPEKWNKFDILQLRMIFEAIGEGETTIENEFPAPPPPETKETPSNTIVTPSGVEVQGVNVSRETAGDAGPASANETKAAPAETKAPPAETKPAPRAKTPEELAEEREAAEAEAALSKRAAPFVPPTIAGAGGPIRGREGG
jgi:hypothetical protein